MSSAQIKVLLRCGNVKHKLNVVCVCFLLQQEFLDRSVYSFFFLIPKICRRECLD